MAKNNKSKVRFTDGSVFKIEGRKRVAVHSLEQRTPAAAVLVSRGVIQFLKPGLRLELAAADMQSGPPHRTLDDEVRRIVRSQLLGLRPQFDVLAPEAAVPTLRAVHRQLPTVRPVAHGRGMHAEDGSSLL